MTRKDEIGTLASEFDLMCSRLQSAQVKLMEKSYHSGMTEMSSGILHNVRNALSPITTRIERIKGQFKDIPMDNLEKAKSELQHGSLDPQRRQDLMRFVDLTFKDVLDSLKDMVSGLDDLADQVFQIEDMLNMQRTFGREDKPVEFVTPSDLLNRALEMVPENHRDECRISIDPRIKKLPAIPVEPTTFVQILQNLVINAAESLEKQKPLCRKISVKATQEEIDGRQLIHWQIEDNGSGIPKEKIQQIFERGASSKRKGLTGIGLHWCANTLTAMKGRIWAESKGEHKGATFHILIPMAPETELVVTTEGETE
jgi:signal transduction histidine kinase